MRINGKTSLFAVQILDHRTSARKEVVMLINTSNPQMEYLYMSNRWMLVCRPEKKMCDDEIRFTATTVGQIDFQFQKSYTIRKLGPPVIILNYLGARATCRGNRCTF